MERPTVLIVEDDPEIRDHLKWALASKYVVFETDNRPHAVALINQHRPSLVTLDLGLAPFPDDASEGLAALEEFLIIDPLIKVVVMTGNSQRETALRAVQAGAFDYIRKPIQLNILQVILERAVHLYTLQQENQERHTQWSHEDFNDVQGKSPAMQRIFAMVRRVAATDVPVLITGESGTGKSLIARAIHRASARHGAPFVAINCGAIPEHLLESELFGHERGAFTGAHIQRKGRIEQANGGVLFLDEIGDLPLPLQVKLLHVLQEQRIVRVGGREEIAVDARVIAATNRDLHSCIQAGAFREDLFYRLQVVTIHMPPLRDRGDDIMLLAHEILQRGAKELKKNLTGFTSEGLKALKAHNWPGNVRELENRIKRAAVMADGQRLTSDDLELTSVVVRYQGQRLKDVRHSLEKEFICKTLAKYGGNITKTAAELGVSRPTLHGLLTKYAIQR
jgi:two-component system, NtrC family, response regulator